MATIKDVAIRANVSIKTVSRVINGSSDVTPATRQRVQRAADELGYRSNAAARRLVTGRSDTVGVVIPKSASYVFSHLYFNEVLGGIGEVLGDHGLDLLLHLGRDGGPYADLIRHHKVDGLILLAILMDDPLLADLPTSDVPVVYTCRVRDDDLRLQWVESDASGGIESAVNHLASMGHVRIGMLTGPDNSMLAREQVEGFRRSIASRGFDVAPSWMQHADYSVESGERAARRVLASGDRPTALVCADDMTAIGAIRAAGELGLRVPNDLSVTGFDDVVLARYSTPALTTVRQDAFSKGRLAAERLVAMLSRTTGDTPWHVRLETELVVRASTGAPALISNRDLHARKVGQG